VLKVDQRNASAGRDVVAGNVTNYNFSPTPPSVIEQLLDKLQKEMETNDQVQSMIERLRDYYEHKASDGVSVTIPHCLLIQERHVFFR
jgi:hypothetical protein